MALIYKFTVTETLNLISHALCVKNMPSQYIVKTDRDFLTRLRAKINATAVRGNETIF